jgi:hypothetical protein
MAAGKWKVYDTAKKFLADGTFDMDNASLGLSMALFLSTSNANTLTNSLYGDLTNEVATAFGYTQLGQALTGETWQQSGATTTADSDNVTWTASGGSITARYAVIYCNATVNSHVKPLLAVCLLNVAPADETVTDGNDLTVAINASGIFTLTGATTD